MIVNCVQTASSLVVKYLGEIEYHKQLAIKYEIESTLSSAYEIEIPSYILKARAATKEFFQEYNSGITANFLSFKDSPEQREYEQSARRAIVEGAQRISIEKPTALFLGPGHLEKETFATLMKKFKVTLVDNDPSSLKTVARDLPGRENISLSLRDLTRGLWGALPILFQIKEQRDKNLKSVAGKGLHDQDALKPAVVATHLALDILIAMAENYSCIPTEDDLIDLCEPQDYLISLNVSTELVSSVKEVATRALTCISSLPLTDKGIFREDRSLKDKYYDFRYAFVDLKEKVIYRYLMCLKSMVKPTGLILFGDTMFGHEHATKDRGAVVSTCTKFPVFISNQLHKIFSRVDPLKPLSWPLALKDYNQNPDRAYSWDVQLFYFSM